MQNTKKPAGWIVTCSMDEKAGHCTCKSDSPMYAQKDVHHYNQCARAVGQFPHGDPPKRVLLPQVPCTSVPSEPTLELGTIIWHASFVLLALVTQSCTSSKNPECHANRLTYTTIHTYIVCSRAWVVTKPPSSPRSDHPSFLGFLSPHDYSSEPSI